MSFEFRGHEQKDEVCGRRESLGKERRFLFHDDSGITAPTLKGTYTRAVSVLLSPVTSSEAGNGRVVHHQSPRAGPLPPPSVRNATELTQRFKWRAEMAGTAAGKRGNPDGPGCQWVVSQSLPPVDPGSTAGRLDSPDAVKRITDLSARGSGARFRHKRIAQSSALVTTLWWL